MPAGRLAHICLLVRDLDLAMERWRGLLGVLDPGQLEDPVVRMGPFEAGGDTLTLATFASSTGCEIQLLQPVGDGPAARRLASHGEGVHHIAFVAEDVEQAASDLRQAGTHLTSEAPLADPALPWQHFTFIAPAVANGVMVEVCTGYQPVAGRWEPSA